MGRLVTWHAAIGMGVLLGAQGVSAPAASADVIYLKDGGQMEVESWRDGGDTIELTVGGGTVRIPKADVSRIEATRQPPAPASGSPGLPVAPSVSSPAPAMPARATQLPPSGPLGPREILAQVEQILAGEGAKLGDESLLYQLAALWARAGDAPAALRAANAIWSLSARNPVRITVARVLAQAGDRATAQRILGDAVQETLGLSDLQSAVLLLNGLALAQVEVGDSPGARETGRHAARLIGARPAADARGHDARVQVVNLQVHIGDVTGALQTSQQMPEQAPGELFVLARDDAKFAIALAQARTGNAQPAIEMVRTLKQKALGTRLPPDVAELNEAMAFRTIVGVQLEGRDVAGAMRTVGLAPAPVQASLLHEIALAQAKAGDAQGALRTMSAIKGGPMLAGELASEIAGAQVRAGDVEGALRTAESIGHPYTKAVALRAVGLVRAEAGDRSRAMASLERARQVAAAMPEDAHRNRATLLAFIAEAYAKIGDADAAQRILGDVGDPGVRAHGLRRIAVHLGTPESLSDAVARAMAEPSPTSRARELLRVAAILLERSRGTPVR
jgi:thioredoxin-like negative regulator of GroEL